MPEDLLALWMVEWQQFQLAALLPRSLKIPQRLLRGTLVQTSDDSALKQALADIPRNFCRASDPGLSFYNLAVLKRDANVLYTASMSVMGEEVCSR